MIKRLYIRNYAIIEELEVDFSKGLTIITGETGAGKSILLGALGLIMGRRADTKSLYHEEEKCVIEANFDIEAYELSDFFEENELEYERDLIIRREISPSGKSRAFVNDTPANLKVLQSLSAALLDLHQQFDTLDINNMDFQLKMLDALADNKNLLRKYRKLYQDYQANRSTLSKLRLRNENSAKEMEFIEFQLKEFNEAELKVGEQETLEEELSRLQNAEEIKKTLNGAFQHLSESEQAVLAQLQDISVAINQIAKYDSGIQNLYNRFNGLVLEMQELANEFEETGSAIEDDPERIQEIEDRLDLIYRLQNKHQVASIEELVAIQEGLEQQLKGFGDLSDEIAILETRIDEQEAQLVEIARSLSERRKSVVDGFQAKVEGMLGDMSMEYARLQVQFNVLQDLGPQGWDQVVFLFAANKGSRLQEIRDVASGGELSRLALAIKSLVASAIPLPTMIFDEIDTGISGDVALKMGKILRQLSDEHQVVSITHSPQVASKADRHYFVYKRIKEDRTVTRVKMLQMEDRVEVIATMLSQSPPTESAIENAKELLRIA